MEFNEAILARYRRVFQPSAQAGLELYNPNLKQFSWYACLLGCVNNDPTRIHEASKLQIEEFFTFLLYQKELNIAQHEKSKGTG